MVGNGQESNSIIRVMQYPHDISIFLDGFMNSHIRVCFCTNLNRCHSKSQKHTEKRPVLNPVVFQWFRLLNTGFSMMLCDVCLKAFPSAGPIPRTAPEDAVFDMFPEGVGIYQESQFVPHHSSFLSLKASMDSGCLICAAFWNSQEASVIATQLELEASLSTNLRPTVDVIQPGTQLGIHTWMEFHPAVVDGSKYKVSQEVVIKGYRPDPDNQFNVHSSIRLTPKGARCLNP